MSRYFHDSEGLLVKIDGHEIIDRKFPVAVRLARKGDRMWMSLGPGKEIPWGKWRYKEAAASLNTAI